MPWAGGRHLGVAASETQWRRASAAPSATLPRLRHQQIPSQPCTPALGACLHHVVPLVADGKHARLSADVAQVGAVEVVGQPVEGGGSGGGGTSCRKMVGSPEGATVFEAGTAWSIARAGQACTRLLPRPAPLSSRSLDHRLVVDVAVLGDLGGVDLQDLHARLLNREGGGGGAAGWDAQQRRAVAHVHEGQLRDCGAWLQQPAPPCVVQARKLASLPPVLACSLGSGISILRSSRPGRMRAGSSTSGRLVAATSLTCATEGAVARRGRVRGTHAGRVQLHPGRVGRCSAGSGAALQATGAHLAQLLKAVQLAQQLHQRSLHLAAA